MAATHTGTGTLDRARDALFGACRRAHRLADATDALEAEYAHETGSIHADDFYAPSTMPNGRALDPDWSDNAPAHESRVRRNAIDAALSLREAVDAAIEMVAGVAIHIDSPLESVDRRWSTRTIGQLRVLRGAILRGHQPNIMESALPMIRAGVPAALREAAKPVAERMEEVKSAILAGLPSTACPVAVTATPNPRRAETPPPRGASAEARAIDALRRDPSLAQQPAHVWATRIGCSVQRVRNLKAWKTAKARGGAPRRAGTVGDRERSPTPIEQREAGETQLRRLAAEQAADAAADEGRRPFRQRV